jgi:hypothetical protein
MDITQPSTKLHPEWLSLLFAHQSKVRRVFRDVLGILEINHIALTYIQNQTMLTLSSTPAIEYNLFSSGLWRFDSSYHPDWFTQCTRATWQSLYTPLRYDELYYLKQVKPQYPLGMAIASKLEDGYVVYSLASHQDNTVVQEHFNARPNELLQIGQYCMNQLRPVFMETAYVLTDHSQLTRVGTG